MRYRREVMKPDIMRKWHEVMKPDIWYLTNDLARLVLQEIDAEGGMSFVAAFRSTVNAARHLGDLDTRDEQTENTCCGHDCECYDH